MTTWWQQQLESLGATMEDGVARDFGDAAVELASAANGAVFADLSHLGLIQVSGTDALTFLQGQLTQDVENITVQRAAYAGYCSPKGRLLAHFLAWKSDDCYFLQLPRELVEPIQKRLKMYVLRSKVMLADASATHIRFGVGGANAASLIASTFGSVPSQSMDIAHTPTGNVIALPNGQFQVNVLGDATALWNTLANNATPVGAPEIGRAHV